MTQLKQTGQLKCTSIVVKQHTRDHELIVEYKPSGILKLVSSGVTANNSQDNNTSL